MHRPPEPRRPARPEHPAARAARAPDAGGSTSDGALDDPAARHANALLRDLGLSLPVAARPEPTSPALDWARSGAMALTGEPGGAPGFASGPLASAARGAGMALAALAPGRDFDGLDAPALLSERAALFGLARRGAVSCGGSARLLPTREGFLAVNLPRDDDWALLPAWLECERPAGDDGRDWNALARALTVRSAEPLVERGRELGLAVACAVAAPPRAKVPLRFEPSARTTSEQARGARPRVLDLSSLWAGPLAGALLAQAGAEVLKLESPKRPDGARAGEPRFFSLLNADKHGCALDLAEPGDREVFVRLLESADVVLESARPRALAQLGIDAQTWLAGKPGRLWTSITGYGRDHEWIAFGDDAAVAAGLAFDPGCSTSSPRFCADAIADPLTGLTAAVAILALRAQGRGGLLSLALADVAAHAAQAPLDPHAADDGACAAAAASLLLPVARRDGVWQVRDGAAWIPVAAPRARSPRGEAPPLAPPEAELVAAWTRAC